MISAKTLGWIHLTDLHVGQPREGGRLANIERSFLDDLTRVLEPNDVRPRKDAPPPIAVVFFSGDIAFRGIESEYVRATAVLGRICDHIAGLNQKRGAPPPVLFPVPGNHDLVRPSPVDGDTIRKALGGRTASSAPLWQPGQDDVRALIDELFAGYAAWLRDHPLPFPPTRTPGSMPGDLRASVVVNGVSLGIVGLNSSCLHLADESPGTQHIDLSQVRALVGNDRERWIASHHFNVLVTHHPPTWLSPEARRILDEEIKPDALFDLHLYGHEHVGRHVIDPGTDGVRHLLEGRSLFGAEESGSPRLHGYTIGRLVLEGTAGKRTGRTKRVEVWTRQGWRGPHGWKFGPSDERWGRWRIQIELGDTVLTDQKETPPPKHIAGLGRLDLSAKAPARWRRVKSAKEVGAEIDSIKGRRWILLSASVPTAPGDPERRRLEKPHLESARPAEILSFVRALARRVSKRDSGLGLIFGGHPTITVALAPLVLANPADSPWLALVQDESYWANLVDDVAVLVHAPSVLTFFVSDNGPGTRLDLLRQALIAPTELAAAIFVGGLSGINKEFALVGEHRPKVPRFAVGLGGGASAALLLDDSTADVAMGKGAPGGIKPAELWYAPERAAEAILRAIMPAMVRSRR